MKKAAPKANAQNAEDLAFEAALQELENVAERLETGRVPLEESLQLLQRGLGLIERCENELTQAESILEQLMISPEGELHTVRLDVEEEDEIEG